MQAIESATAREMARKERERLKQQDKMRREQLERFRETANTDASKGEVRRAGIAGALMCPYREADMEVLNARLWSVRLLTGLAMKALPGSANAARCHPPCPCLAPHG